MRQCVDCLVWKDESEFGKLARRSDGLAIRCKVCWYVYQKDWNSRNQDKHSSYMRNWDRANADKVNEAQARRKALQLGATVGDVFYKEILRRDGLICHICLGDVASHDVHFDHVVALVNGGAHSMENIKVAHSSCNLSKGQR